MKTNGLYVITDGKPRSLTELSVNIEACLKSTGIALVQYRDKSNDHTKRSQQASTLLKLCRQYNTPFLINDDVILAKEIGADGVHLGQTDMPISQARELLGPDAIIGITCHASLELAKSAQAASANYVAFGRFFPSSSKPNAQPAPLYILTEAKKQLNIPIVAIGGITPENASTVLHYGADMLAVINGLFASNDITSMTKAYLAAWQEQALS